MHRKKRVLYHSNETVGADSIHLALVANTGTTPCATDNPIQKKSFGSGVLVGLRVTVLTEIS